MALFKQPYQYVMDSSALFDLKDRYPQKIFGGLWDRFNEMCDQQLIVFPREVLKEINAGTDELIEWAKYHDEIFLDPCEDEQLLLPEILQIYPNSILQKYGTKNWADPFVIACARYYSIAIIQQEINEQYRIPGIAKKFSLECHNLVSFFEQEGWSFN